MAFALAQNTSAFLKMGLLGFEGSGKTKTAAKVAIGLVQYMKKLGLPQADKPVYFIDTETGSDFVAPDFAAAGIPLAIDKTRAFTSLVEAVKIAERDGALLMADSVTHFWKELCESYCRNRAKQLRRDTYRLQLNDWSALKGEAGWGKFSDLFVNSRVHIIIAGRAGYEFDMDRDEEGNKELLKTDVKMKAEGEFGYEPSLLVQMTLCQKLKGKKVVEQWREATVRKDRCDLIDGKVFKNPDFESFWPHISRLNLGGAHVGFDATRNSVGMFPAEPRDDRTIQRQIVLDEIQSLLLIHHPSTSGEDKKAKLEYLRTHFNAAWKEMESLMSLERLRKGYDTLHHSLEGKHSRYHAEFEAAPEINDELPGDLAPHKGDGLDIPPTLDRRRKANGTPKGRHELTYVDLVNAG